MSNRQSAAPATKSKNPLISLDPNYSMKINIYYRDYKWKIITFLVRTTRNFHFLVFPWLVLQISYHWYLLWPNLIHSFMKLSQAPAEVINYSSLECLYLRRSQYWVRVHPKASSLCGPLVAWGCYFPLNSEMRCPQLKIHIVLSHKLQRSPSKRGSDPLWLLCVLTTSLAIPTMSFTICSYLVIRTALFFFMTFSLLWISLKS